MLTEVVFIFLAYALNIVGASLVLINIGFKFDLDVPFPHGKNAVPLGLLTGFTNHHFQFNQVLLPPPLGNHNQPLGLKVCLDRHHHFTQ